MENYIMLCEQYNAMSQNFYQQYLDTTKYIEENQFNEIWNILDHTDSENDDFLEKLVLKLRCAISAVIFQALAVEAFVNLYGAVVIGETEYYKQYENSDKRLNTLEKLKKICINKYNKNYPTNTQDYTALYLLFQKRDKIVHTKPKSNKSGINSQEFHNYLFNEVDFIYKDIDLEMNTYQKVKDNLAKIDGTNCDLTITIRQNEYTDIIDNIKKIFGIGMDNENN